MSAERVIDFLAYRRRTDTPEPLRTMTPEQHAQRKLMEEKSWKFFKITAVNDVVMTMGEPWKFIAFITDSGFTEQYQYREEWR